MHKRADLHWDHIIGLIIILVSFFFLLKATLFASQEANFTRKMCEVSVLMREKLTVDLGPAELKAFPLECSTIRKDLPLEPYPKSMTDMNRQEIIEKQIGEWVASCWLQFGQGYVTKNVFNKAFFTHDKCFICNKFKINDMPGSITKQELEHYLSTATYKLMIKQVCGSNSNFEAGGGASGGAGATGSWEECREVKEECEYNGGKCLAGCSGLHEVEWSCSAGNKCCVEPSMVTSYLDYIQMGERGKLDIKDDLLVEAKKDIYAITFISATDFSFNTNPFSDPEKQRIFISRFNDVKDKCHVVD